MEGLMQLVRAFGDSIEGRLRIQKAAYFLKVLGAPEFSRTRFRYHYYGPYSRELSGSLQEAVASGLLKEEGEGTGFDSIRYTYRLTEAGERWLEDAPQHVEESFAAQIPLLKRAQLKTLELAATIAFLEREEKTDREAAVSRALALKPNCAAWKTEAETLLSELGVRAPS
jgi:hypothetical protein